LDEFGTGGGSLALAELIDEHGDALLADFLEHYGVHLPDVLFEWPPRLLLSLAVEGLPFGCRLFAHMEGGSEGWRELHGWDKDRAMFADYYDLFAAAQSWKGKPPTYPRPGVKRPAQGTPLFAMRPRTNKGD
jgi:hypothetical protein